LCTGLARLALALAPSVAWSAPPAAAAPAAPAPYVLANTEVHTLHAAHLNRDYELYVSLPPSYASGDRRYPVVFVTDANYAFPLVRSIEARIAGHSQEMPEFILVGLGYATGDTPEYSRRRDYTPSPHGDKDAVSDMPGRPPLYGEAEGYRRFIADEVFPFVSGRYRADMTRKIFAGHSYGSLFGAYVLLTAPRTFDGYVLGSPSLWFDRHLLVDREREAAAARPDLRATVYLGVGGFETRAPKNRRGDPRYDTEGDMVADTTAFARALASHRYPGLHLRSEIIPGEDHLTVAPTLITHGLMWTLAAH
jgi:predicted alpha/beta superfamily hydrolase